MQKTLLNIVLFSLIITTILNATSWTEKNKIIASNRGENNQFGNSVDAYGDYVIVGAPNEDSNAGAAYIYKKDLSGNWTQIARLTASDRAADDYFGYSVSIYNNFALVGAYNEEEADLSGNGTVIDAGSVYFFKNDGSDNWTQVQKKVASHYRTADAHYGCSVSIKGEYAVVGANGYMYSKGLAYVLKKGTYDYWNEIQVLYSTDGSAYDNFGTSVDIEETTNIVVVGAINEDEDANGQNPKSSAGSAYVFNNDGSDNYFQAQKIVADASRRQDHAEFGVSVSISGNYIVVGARTESRLYPSEGEAYIFKKIVNKGNWSQIKILNDADPEDYAFFGKSVSIDSNRVIIGACGNGTDASKDYKSSAGTAYIFKNDGSDNWTLENKLLASDRNDCDYFGFCVAINGEVAVVGAVYEDDDTYGNNYKIDAGSAYIFTNKPITEYYVSTVGHDETGNGSSTSPWATIQKAVNSFSDSNAANTIHVRNGTFTETVQINKGFSNLTISGNLSKTSIVQAAATTSEAAKSVFEIADNQTVTIEKMTIQHGNSSSNGGGIANGTGTLTVNDCTLKDNLASGKGGGIYNKGTAVISNSTFDGNKAVSCGGGYAGDVSASDKITNCTFANNGGINGVNGGAIFLTSFGNSTYYLTNCTIANNSTGTSSGEGGGVYVMGGTLVIKNTIIANNRKAGVDNDFYQEMSTITDNGYNIVEVSNGYTFSAAGDLTGTDLTLNLSSTLEDNTSENGTQTLKLTSGSVAIDAGNSTPNSTAKGSVDVPTKDQRGVDRNGTTDIGAYEFDGNLPVELISFTASVIDNSVILNWRTETETNNYGFQVERKKEKCESNWKNIGFVEGAGNSNSPKKYSFADNVTESGRYSYRLKQIDLNGTFEYSNIVEVNIGSPDKFELMQNYPNPFNPTTTIKYTIPAIGNVETLHATSLNVYNILGETIATLVNEKQAPGTYAVKFDASNLPSGVYFYTLQYGNFVATKKMILLK